MNYLAHLLLADMVATDPKALVGNLMGDFVKGSLDTKLDPVILEAIRLHRKIDAFTDKHLVVLETKKHFSSSYRRFAGVILDISFDHFLCRHWDTYCAQTLDDFTRKSYRILEHHYELLPSRLQAMLPRMIENDLLGSYLTLGGIERALNRISRRSPRLAPLAGATSEIRQNYDRLENGFLAFFPDLVGFVHGSQDTKTSGTN